MSGWTILYCVFLLVIFLVSLGLITQASTYIGASNTDPNLQQAYKITTIIAVVLWFAIAAVIIGGILLFVFGGEAIEAESIVTQYQNYGNIWSTILFIIFMLLLIVVGVGAAAAAVSISKFNGYQNNQNIMKAFDDCCLAAGLCLGTLLIIIGIFIIRYFYSDNTNNNTNTSVALVNPVEPVKPTNVILQGKNVEPMKLTKTVSQVTPVEPEKNIKDVIAEEAVKQVVK